MIFSNGGYISQNGLQ